MATVLFVDQGELFREDFREDFLIRVIRVIRVIRGQ